MNSTKITNTKLAITFALLFLIMSITRGSHLLTSISLPDASFALFLIGGLLLKKPKWFISLLMFSFFIDLLTLSVNNMYQIPINLGYLGLLPSYGVMWIIGSRITNTKSFLKFTTFSAIATLITFLISTQTYNLLSGTFPSITIKQSLQTGWEYLPQTFIYTMSYLVIYWGIQSLLKGEFVSQKASVLK
jgi:hypothetical protein